MKEILIEVLSNIFLALLTLTGAYFLYFINIFVSYLKDKIKSNR